jgi:hypothetical protein
MSTVFVLPDSHNPTRTFFTLLLVHTKWVDEAEIYQQNSSLRGSNLQHRKYLSRSTVYLVTVCIRSTGEAHYFKKTELFALSLV